MTYPQAIANQLDILHQAKPWFGTGMEESLQPLSEELFHHQLNGRSVARLIGHIIAWRRNAYKRLAGLPYHKIELNTPADWPDYSEKTKIEMLAELVETKKQLQSVFHTFPVEKLDEKLHSDYYYTNRNLLEGIIQHDIYHLGQINLLIALLKDTPAT